MPAPAFLAPVALRLAQGVAVAAVAYYAGKRAQRGPGAVWRERALDETPEGLSVDFDAGDADARASGGLRWRRAIFAGRRGVELDLAALFRARARRVDME